MKGNNIETWRDVVGFENKYKISNFGNVMGVNRKVNSMGGYRTIKEKVLKKCIDRKGYVRYNLSSCSKSKNSQAHRLVALAFIPNIEKKTCVNHINGIKTDNRVENLEWVTWSENELHSYSVLGKENSKSCLGKFGSLHHRSRKVICNTLGITFGSMNEAARELGLSQSNIHAVINNIRLHTEGLVFNYVV